MKLKNKLKFLVIAISFILSIISVNAVISCNTDSDCSSNSDLFKNGKCLNNQCKFISFYSNDICRNDNDCKLPGTPVNNRIVSRCSKANSNSEFGICSHIALSSSKNESSCYFKFNGLSLDESLKKYSVNILNYPNTHYCQYYKKELCDNDNQCSDGILGTKDVCSYMPRFDEKNCLHINYAEFCSDNSDCPQDNIPGSYSFCRLGTHKCKTIDLTDVKNNNIYLFTYLNYVNNINIIAHYNNGDVENFSVNVKSGTISKNLSNNALLALEIYQDTIEKTRELVKKITYNDFNKKYYNEDQRVFMYIFNKYLSSYLGNQFINACTITKINNNKWNELINA